MPKTKVSSKKKKDLSECLPSLDGLKLDARGQKLESDEEPEEEPEEDESSGTPATVTRKPAVQASGHGLSQVSRKNLRELFSAEETVVETITLEGRGAKYVPPKSENMPIFLRVRPLLQQEVDRGENKGSFLVLPQGKGIALNPPVNSHLYRRLANSQDGKVGYEFTQVLGDDLHQRDVFEITMRKPIQEFLGGTSQLIFTYGVTNSGKTYTLLGPKGHPGILPRALDRIFAAVGVNISQLCKYQPIRYEDILPLDGQKQREARERREDYLAQNTRKGPKIVLNSSQGSSMGLDGKQSTGSQDYFEFRGTSEVNPAAVHDRDGFDHDATYEAWVSFVEIYEDVAYDLLDTTSAKVGRTLRSGTLKVTEEGDTCYAKGLIELPVSSAAHAYEIMVIGRKNLHVAATKLNEASSRSHSIFTIKLVKISAHKEAIVTQLTFCDLAGTERANRTENVGARLKESQNINKDLHHLKECIEALRKSNMSKTGRKKDLVPYRNCKLTRLFRSFFSGKGKASMIVNISQCATDFDETVQAIRFGSSAMQIMIAMSRRESILIQPPRFNGKKQIYHQNVVSVQMEEAMDDIEESDEDEDTEAENRAPPSTVKKQPRGHTSNNGGSSATVVKKKPPLTAVKDKNSQGTAVKVAGGSSTIKKRGRKTATAERGRKRSTPLDQDSTSEEGSTSDANTSDGDVVSGDDVGSSTLSTEEEEYGETSEADLTLGGAVRGDFSIPDDFWVTNCPFPDFVQEEDSRIRGLLLLLGSCQAQIKQNKAQNMANEMKVRKDLCDYYDKEREKQARENARNMKKREIEFEEDLKKQLQYQREAMERQFQGRDPSLLSFESHERDEENEDLKARNAELEERIRELQAGGN